MTERADRKNGPYSTGGKLPGNNVANEFQSVSPSVNDGTPALVLVPREGVSRRSTKDMLGSELHADSLRGPGQELEGVRTLVDVDDFNQVVARFQEPIIAFLTHLLRNRDDALDISQVTFMKAFRAFADGTTINPNVLSSWLFRIAQFSAYDALRKSKRTRATPFSLFRDPSDTNPGDASEDERMSAKAIFGSPTGNSGLEQRIEDEMILTRVFSKIPRKQARYIYLCDWQGLTHEEVAALDHTKPGAIRMRHLRAKERFITVYNQEMRFVAED